MMQLQLVAQSIPTWRMRYATVGDWQWKEVPGKATKVRVSVAETGNMDYDFLVAIHELIEAYLCYRRGITPEMVDKHDLANADYDGEPGDLPDAPYKYQHQIATVVEFLLLSNMSYDVKAYEDRLEEIYQLVKDAKRG